jgi:hypothetical protein
MAFQVPKLGDDALRYVPGPPIFQQLTADILGNAATDSDGHDAEFQDVLTLLAGESQGISTLDSEITAAAFTPGQFEAVTLAPMADELSAAISDAGSAINDFTGSMGGTPDIPTMPETNPAPPVDLSGGAGGGVLPGDEGVPLPPTGPDNAPTTPTTPTPPPIPPEGPTGTLDASTGQTGTLPPGGPPIQEPADLPLGPSPFGPADAGGPVDSGPVIEPTDLPLGPSPFLPPDVLPPQDAGGGSGGSGSGTDSGDSGGGDDTGFDFEDE